MVMYPHSMTQHPSSSSKGSFVPFFVVLGIIAALTVMACIVGQVCARRYLRPRHRRDHVPYQSDGDVEGGIQMKSTRTVPSAANAKRGDNVGGLTKGDGNHHSVVDEPVII